MMQTKMIGSAYPAARGIAPRVHEHFARHLAAARLGAVERIATLPDVDTIEAMIETAFWASLRREETYIPRISLAFLSPDQTDHPLIFAEPLPFESAALVRLAPAVERAGIHLGVSRNGAGGLSVWGTAVTVPTFCLVVEAAAPGLLVIKHHRGEETVKYVNVAVLEGDQVKLVDETASTLPDCPALVGSLLGFDSPKSWFGSMNVLVQLAVSMRAHGRGGLLLVVPAASESWRDSMVSPMSYAITPAYRGLSELLREGGGNKTYLFQQTLREVVDVIAGLTAVDGAAVMTDSYELLAFGAKIARRRGSPQVELVTVTEPVVGGEARTVTPAQLGGTRHLSAAQFVHDQRDGVAFVASQDGRFTIFAWSPCEEMVHAHRVEALLL